MSAELKRENAERGAAEAGGSLILEAAYEPDERESARVLLMILGLPADEIERVVSNLTLDSLAEM